MTDPQRSAAPAMWPLRQVLALAPVRRLWTAQIVSILGDLLALYGLLSAISFRMHGTAMQVSLVSLFYLAPLAVIAPFAGVLVDRWDARRTMIASDCIRAVFALGLVFAPTLPLMYAAIFLISAVSCLFIPAQSVAIRALVPREGLLSANALMQQAMQLARLASPALAAALVAWIGPSICFYLDAASFVVSALLISAIRLPAAAPLPQGIPGMPPRSTRGVLDDLREGIRFLFTHATLSFVVVSMALGTFVVSCFAPLLAIYLRDQVHAGVIAYGLLSTVSTVGMIAATVAVVRLSKRATSQQLVFAGLAGIGAGIAFVALVHFAPLVAIGSFAMGFGMSLVVAPAQTLLQQETPFAMMGRVSSSTMSLLSISQVLGLLVCGTAAEAVGARKVFFICAALLLALAAFGLARISMAAPRAVSSELE